MMCHSFIREHLTALYTQHEAALCQDQYVAGLFTQRCCADQLMCTFLIVCSNKLNRVPVNYQIKVSVDCSCLQIVIN